MQRIMQKLGASKAQITVMTAVSLDTTAAIYVFHNLVPLIKTLKMTL